MNNDSPIGQDIQDHFYALKKLSNAGLKGFLEVGPELTRAQCKSCGGRAYRLSPEGFRTNLICCVCSGRGYIGYLHVGWEKYFQKFQFRVTIDNEPNNILATFLFNVYAATVNRALEIMAKDLMQYTQSREYVIKEIK